MLYHYYHIYADGDWLESVTEHFKALRDSGLLDELPEVCVGIVGAAEKIEQTLTYLDQYGAKVRVVSVSETGWEQVTQREIWRMATHVDNDEDNFFHEKDFHQGKVLYCHTKGAANKSHVNDAWRRSMTKHVIGNWRDAVQKLDHYDCAGCHWMKPTNNPEGGYFFAGTFWWATLKHIRRIGPPGEVHRHQAEEWIGYQNPVVHDYKPGHPGLDNF